LFLEGGNQALLKVFAEIFEGFAEEPWNFLLLTAIPHFLTKTKGDKESASYDSDKMIKKKGFHHL